MRYDRSRFIAALILLALVVTPMTLAIGDDWPQWRGPTRDGVWRETGIIEKFSSEQVPIKWSVPLSSGYSGPSIADGRVFVTDRVAKPKQIERVHCFSEKDGTPLWSFKYDCAYRGVSFTAGPRASVSIDDDRAYSLGTMGHMYCFDVADGTVKWSKDLNAEFEIDMPGWGISAAPLIDGDLIIAQIGGTKGACIVALDKHSGDERWRALSDRASYAAPIIIEQANERVLVCWTGDNVVGLNPTTGEVHWQHPFQPTRMVIGIATPVVHNNRLLVTSFYDGALMLKLNENRLAIEQLWRRLGPDERHTDSLHSIISTPYLAGDYIYGVDSYGELRCLEAKTGDRIWEDVTATRSVRWGNIHMVKNGDKIWMFNELGELIIAKLSPAGYDEISRAKLIEPTTDQLRRRDEGVCWAHPAYANRHVFARSDKELVCASLAAE